MTNISLNYYTLILGLSMASPALLAGGCPILQEPDTRTVAHSRGYRMEANSVKAVICRPKQRTRRLIRRPRAICRSLKRRPCVCVKIGVL